MTEHNNTCRLAVLMPSHILSMPDISSDASNVLFCTSLLFAPGFCFNGDGFAGDENIPVISSSPFSSSRPRGSVIPLRLKVRQRIQPTGSPVRVPSSCSNCRIVVVALAPDCRSGCHCCAMRGAQLVVRYLSISCSRIYSCQKMLCSEVVDWCHGYLIGA